MSNTSCPKNTLQCTKERIFISKLNISDGFYDCQSGEDEKNCPMFNKFICQSFNQEISIQNVCDFVPDYRDKSHKILNL